MKKGWETKRLGEVCEVIGGGTPAKNNAAFYTGAIPWATVRDMRQDEITETEFRITKEAVRSSATNIVPAGNVVIATRVGLGKICLLGQDTAINQDLRGIIPRDEKSLTSRYLFWWFKSIAKEIVAEGKGATVQGVKLPFVKSLPIPVPPLPEQRRIVGLLDEAFAAIATAKANAEKNLQNAREIFESHLNEVFAKKGEGWVERRIGEICTLRSGTTVSPRLEKTIGDFPYLKVADMNFGGNEGQITTSSRFLDKADVKKNAIIPKGATIFPKRGGAILTNKKRITSLRICADLNIMAVIPSSEINARMLYYYFVNVDMRKLGTGSSIPQINNYDVDPLLLSFPKSLTTQEKIVAQLDALSAETQRLSAIYSRKLAALEELKQALLHRAFSGEL
jgi:type I restriction enzyme S subunit